MPQKLIAALSPTRLNSYHAECASSQGGSSSQATPAAVASLYAWHVSLCSAWYETLSYAEAVVRNSVDLSLREWNTQQGMSDDWLGDAKAPLKGLVYKANKDTEKRALQASRKRDPSHPRYQAPPSLDDRVSQLEFGNIAYLFPSDPPADRSSLSSGFTGRENLWIHGLSKAFPLLTSFTLAEWNGAYPSGLPAQVEGGYAVGHALERLRRLRNRVSHHEQTFRVNHLGRLADVNFLLRNIEAGAADDLEKLDRVRSALTMRPHP